MNELINTFRIIREKIKPIKEFKKGNKIIVVKKEKGNVVGVNSTGTIIKKPPFEPYIFDETYITEKQYDKYTYIKYNYIISDKLINTECDDGYFTKTNRLRLQKINWRKRLENGI